MKRYLISIEELSEPTHDHRAYDSDEIFSAKVEGDATIVAGVHKVVLDYLTEKSAPIATYYGKPVARGKVIKVEDDRSPATN